MKGWRTRTFTERSVFHHRKLGTGGSKRLSALFRHGRKDYYLGNHPVWEIFRTLYQMRHKPYGIGGMAIFAGYLTSFIFIRRARRPAPPEVIRFCRREQIQRLGAALKTRKLGGTVR
jgi:hypothetical protein